MSNINIFEWNKVKSKIREIRQEIDETKQLDTIDRNKNRYLTNVLRELSVLENMVNDLMDQTKDSSPVNKIKRLYNRYK
ncbi:hypothetical protein [Staphylococcus edaphicus]|uniref:Uncharacterized protein n=1 Tax=Staphylococcus edaphicus TaxID=1955013 RepID=A0A2C6WMD8_9STAP|nr:hypothetical protein [Staphylococcus edaphicus]PHK49313.1 hypothetical protein BTJ66_09080 [Staphylococcus edaphicus]UQW80983.1 hypothetical protein MNY58_10400 [Staphylococcus edaphicus]